MLTVTSIGGRVVVLAASAVAHAAVVVAATSGGHSPSASSLRVDATEIAVDVQPLPIVSDPQPVAIADEAPKPHAPAPHAHTHTHPYPVPPDHDAHPHDPALVHAPLAPNHDEQAQPAHEETASEPAAPASVVSAPLDAPARFTIVIGPASGSFGALASGASGASGGSASASAEAPIVDASTLVEPAKRVAWSEPAYPEAARAAGIEGEVPVEIIVDARGMVESVRVLERAGYGLDDAAIAAVRRWRFSPRTVGGHPVRVRVPWHVAFKLTN
jgi:protein TonB